MCVCMHACTDVHTHTHTHTHAHTHTHTHTQELGDPGADEAEAGIGRHAAEAGGQAHQRWCRPQRH